jgi:hypothetical protein
MATKKTYRLFEDISDVDVSETDIWEYDPEILNHLLIDHTMSAKVRKESNDMTKFANIFWATNDYSERNDGYQYDDQIMPERIVGLNGRVVMPRVLKDKQLQDARVKDKAEVFTPSWVCNAQNNLIDNAWFGRENVFNAEFIDANGFHSWTPTDGKIVFPEDDKQKTWKKYVSENRMEITCGEAPYLVSRYDTTTGIYIPIGRRVGLLDRKLRVVSENTETPGEWLKMARKAYEHTYGYEWQGDNLLLAREALLYTFIEHYIEKFNERDADGKIIVKEIPEKKSIIGIARIISWNLWQMDGIKMVVPDSCDKVYSVGLFGDVEKQECQACKKGESIGHIGVHCLIRDWNLTKVQAEKNGWKPQNGEDPKSSPWQKIRFSTLLNGKQVETENEELEES